VFPLEVLAQVAAAADARALKPQHRERLALHVADGAIALAAGQRTRAAAVIARFVARTEVGAPASASVLASAMRLSEIDDIDRTTAVHPGAMTLPVALAFSADAPAGAAARALDGVLAGYEVATRLASAAGGPRLAERGLAPSLLVAPIAAAAVVGRVRGLSRSQLTQAFALALAQTTRVVGRFGAALPGGELLFGQAVRAGCLAALAAAEGFTGDATLLYPRWLASVDAGGERLHELGAERPAGSVFERLSLRPHCAAKEVLAAIHALRAVLLLEFDARKVESITLGVPSAYATAVDREPATASRAASIVNAPYQLALAALAPHALDDVQREPVHVDRAIAAFAQRVRVVADPNLDALYPAQWPARITVSAGTRTESAMIAESPGDPTLAFARSGVEDKARRMLGDAAGVATVDIALRACEDDAALAELASALIGASI
jgi:2-methylcitrate dehydratase PrpD